MLTLAIENSSAMASVALLDGHDLIEAESYQPQARSQEQALDVIDAMLARHTINIASIEQYVVGRGPGNYTGLRISLAMAQALALPGGRAVLAVSSGAALAHDILSETEAGRVAVIGDARRGAFWIGIFSMATGRLQTESDWQLCGAAELKEMLADGIVVSPELGRIEATLPLPSWCGKRLIVGNRYPRAQTLAALARERCKKNEDFEPLEPLYMHPPV